MFSIGYINDKKRRNKLKNIKCLLSVCLVFIGLFANPGIADLKDFSFIYYPKQGRAGFAEVEIYSDINLHGSNTKNRFQLEYEKTITPMLNIGFYGVIDQYKTSRGLEYAATKVRALFVPIAEGVWPVDIGYYAEYQYVSSQNTTTGQKNPDILEGKLLLGKKIGAYTFAMNYIYKIGQVAGAGKEQSIIAGAAYNFNRLNSIGIETRTDYVGDVPGKQWLMPEFALEIPYGWRLQGAYGMPLNAAAEQSAFARIICAHLL